MKKEINILDNAQLVLSRLHSGVLLTTQSKGEVNSMTIGWGTIGIEWGQPIFTAYVRLHRHTKMMLDESKEFTINVPLDDSARHILGYCGTKSGKDHDKIQDLNLTLVQSDCVQAPGIKELPLTLECKVLYSQDQLLEKIPQEFQKRYYPQDVDSSSTGANQDIHCMYIAQIVKAYILEQ